ncbi:hypothetical protein [uncultured Dokdonia sp.]|uniref:hypothetical protein n=1 Tax=uncultured Dokdonia sp. TaxID=575653 RepID=UPI00261E83B2|nr:hypothetical protein [uncultured Dokdonia sp.]
MEEMPETSAQMQGLTTSQDGVGRVAKLQPVSHFYIHGGNQVGDFTQVANQSFGPVDENQFRTTATVSFSGSKDIYALCMGTVFLQPQTGDTSKINLVLKPFKQPVNGLNIKYIVYRGLEKSDFITTDGKVAGSETSGSGFVKYIWAQYNKFYNVGNGETAPEFKASFLGYPHTPEELQLQETTHLMDQYFFKIASIDETTSEEDPMTSYDLPIIPRGVHLGKATGSIGIDIVLNDGDYIIENDTLPFQLNLEYARDSFYVIDTATETDAFVKKRLKEVATKFIDVAAFYGLHANGAGKLYVDAVDAPLTTKEEIASRLQNYHTKNNFYLYIQANRQRSYNFYGNYTHSEGNDNTIKIGATEDNLSETTFGTNGWPIHIFNQGQDPATENNTVTFQLTTDTYDGAALFVQIGELASPHEENFVRGINLLQELSNAAAAEIDIRYTKTLQLTIPSIGADAITSFSHCIYEGKILEIKDDIYPDQVFYLKDIDDVFGLINAQSVFSLEGGNLPTVVNEQLQIIDFPNSSSNKDIGAIRSQKVEDKIQTGENMFQGRVTYETLMNTTKRDASPYLKKSTPTSDRAKSGFDSFGVEQRAFYAPKPPYSLRTSLFTDNVSNKITSVVLEVEYAHLITKKILGLTSDENGLLKDIAQNVINPKVYFQNTLYNDDDVYLSIENIRYSIYNLSVVGENIFGELTLFQMPNPIRVYSVDGFVFFTDEYAKSIPQRLESDFFTILKI